ncbi:hypothetical protein [Piscirickettsia salmonis]|nr:hypothetical protein [Piscirickettsia salmonis]
MRGKQFIAPMMVEGYCNANVCQAYIDQCLIPCFISWRDCNHG